MVFIENQYDKFMPKKEPYSKVKQNQVKQKIISILEEEFERNKSIKKIILWGSLFEGTFGKYERPTPSGRTGSDIDICFIVDNVFKTDMELLKSSPGGNMYHAGIIDKIHEIRATAFCPDINKIEDAKKLFLPVTDDINRKSEILFNR